ncbi:MAG: hypothetical protein AAF291_07955 [Pseudomonadota bacterium]
MPSLAPTQAVGQAQPAPAPVRAAERSWTQISSGWFMVALACVLIGLKGATLLTTHSLHSIDGAMQTWFALNGFADGQQLGVEFQSYLGITMILALLPAFLALGQTLFASTFAAYAAVIAGAFASAYAIAWWLRIVPRSWRGFAAIAIVFTFYYALRLAGEAVGYPTPASFDPGVSLRPLRGFLPFLALPLFVIGLRALLRTQSWIYGGALGGAAGLGLLWSNDAGIPLVIAMAIGLTAALWPRAGLLAKALAAYAVGALASAAALLLIVTRGAPSGWLKYNFIAVAGDQFWYFGPWDREARILSPLDAPGILAQGEPLGVIGLVLLATYVLIALIRRARGRGSPVREGAFVFVGAAVLGTALIPQIGGHIGAEYNAITFVLGACAPVIVFQRMILRAVKPWLRAIPPRAPALAAVAAGAIMVLVDTASLAAARDTLRTEYIEKLGFFVTPDFAADTRAIQRLNTFWEERGVLPRGRRLLSVYTSALDVAAGTQSPAPVGSLIHALGAENRASYTALVANLDVASVTTIAPDYSGWEGWNLRANWPFFRALRRFYTPIARTDQHVLWVAGGGQTAATPASCEVIRDATGTMRIKVEAQRSGLASVTLARRDFETTGRAAMLTVSEDSPFSRAFDQSDKGPPWGGFPRYGVANARELALVAPVEPDALTQLTLETLGRVPLGEATCSALVYETIDFTALPTLSTGIDRLIGRARP